MAKLIQCLFFLVYSSFISGVILADTESSYAKQNTDISEKLSQIERDLNKIKTLQANFMQIDGSGVKRDGRFLLLRRGNSTFLKMDYINPPTNAIIVKNNRVISFDKELKEKSVFNAYSSPMSFLLERKINLRKNVDVLDLIDKKDEISMTLCKKSDDVDAVVTIYFSKNPFNILRWEIFSNARANIATKIILKNQEVNKEISEVEFSEYD